MSNKSNIWAPSKYSFIYFFSHAVFPPEMTDDLELDTSWSTENKIKIIESLGNFVFKQRFSFTLSKLSKDKSPNSVRGIYSKLDFPLCRLLYFWFTPTSRVQPLWCQLKTWEASHGLPEDCSASLLSATAGGLGRGPEGEAGWVLSSPPCTCLSQRS